MLISVIICTHNPRPDYLKRVLDALKAQTLPVDQWELLLIDNVSKEPLAPVWDLSWHPQARHVREEELGLTAARLRGIRESKGEMLVFVDDDNVLAQDYLSASLELLCRIPSVGVWSGTIRPEFGSRPPRWSAAFHPWLALNQETVERYALYAESAPLPIGAGMVVKREVGLQYYEEMKGSFRRAALDRQGDRTLIAGGDTDMGIVACQMGMGCGRTPVLKLLHLIPSARLRFRYLWRLVSDVQYSHIVLYRLHGLRRGQTSKWAVTKAVPRTTARVLAGALTGDWERCGRGLCHLATLSGTWRALRADL